jgi:hypothetical protein
VRHCNDGVLDCGYFGTTRHGGGVGVGMLRTGGGRLFGRHSEDVTCEYQDSYMRRQWRVIKKETGCMIKVRIYIRHIRSIKREALLMNSDPLLNVSQFVKTWGYGIPTRLLVVATWSA